MGRHPSAAAGTGRSREPGAESPSSPSQDQYNRIHRAILTGLLSNVALHGERRQYTVAGGGKALLWPGSGVFVKRPKWIVAAEIVETGNRYLRTCAGSTPTGSKRSPAT